jgi:hypothetical protein
MGRAAGGRDAETLCNILRLGMREGRVTEKQIAAIVTSALATKRKSWRGLWLRRREFYFLHMTRTTQRTVHSHDHCVNTSPSYSV